MRVRDNQNVLSALRPAAGDMPRHEWVAQELRRLIHSHLSAGDPLPSVRALQKALGVSGPTVRAGQALLAHDGVVEQRHGSGVYVTARATELRIAIVSELNLLHPATSVYFRGAADAARRVLAAECARPQLYIGHYASGERGPEPSCSGFWEAATSGQLDGAIFLTLPNGAEWPARVARCPIPTVGTYTSAVVEANSEQMIVEALQALRAGGVRRCGFIGWGVHSGADIFSRVASDLGIDVRPGWLKQDLDPAYHGSGWSAFRELWASEATKPDGLIVLDDTLFTDTQLAILELGIRVPEQLRIVTQTNRGSHDRCRLPVTALEVDPADAGAGLVDMLLARIHGDTTPQHRDLPHRRIDVRPAWAPTPTPIGITP